MAQPKDQPGFRPPTAPPSQPPPTKKKKTFIEIMKDRPKYVQFANATRVSLGSAFDSWRELKKLKGFKTDSQVAEFLLDW